MVAYAWWLSHVHAVMGRMLSIVMRIRDALPEALSSRLRTKKYRYSIHRLPEPPRSKHAPIRLYIAPANHAGQAYQWARASETIPGVVAVNMVVGANKFNGMADYTAEPSYFLSSKRWQRRHFESISTGFTHVLIEANGPLFGPLFRNNVAVEVRELQKHGVNVAMMCHGSEIRLPSRHVKQHPYSPFKIMSADELKRFENQAVRNRRVLDSLGVPVFLSTPALKIDVPYGRWVPAVVESSRWETDRVALESKVPVVVHAPSRAILKRSDLIDAALTSLEAEGLIAYQRLSGIPNSEMPAILASADVFVDAVGTGNYGVAACEAMASGCVVVSYITDQVSSFVHSETSMTLPIIPTEPDDVSGTIRKVLANRGYYRAISQQGPSFVRRLHNGDYSAAMLRPFLTNTIDS